MSATNTTVAANKVGCHAIALSAATVDAVTFTDDIPYVEVVNLTGTAAIYFSVDGTTPTVGGANTYVIPAAIGSRTVLMPQGIDVVQLISSGTPSYSVMKATRWPD